VNTISKDRKALVRVDFNVPLDKQTNAITDDTRMKAASSHYKKNNSGWWQRYLMSHFGRPKDGRKKNHPQHLVKHLSELLGRHNGFVCQ